MSVIAFAHPSLNKMGGAEKTALDIIEILSEEGYLVHLYTIDKCDWHLIEQRWDISSRPHAEFFFSEAKVDPDNLYDWLKTGLLFVYIILKTHLKYSVTINNYGEAFPFFSEISYFHAEPLYKQGKNPFNIPFWSVMKGVYEKTSCILQERCCKGYFVTNSKFNAMKIAERYGKEPRIVHPFINQIPYFFNPKSGTILTISRITPGKQLFNLASFAFYLPKQTFVLMGPNTPYSNAVLSSLTGIKNLSVIKNPTRQQYEQVIQTSSIVLSTQPNEAFGLSLLEAMSAGCIPIVPKDGGPWVDILDRTEGEAGFAYSSVEEAVEKIRLVLWNDVLRDNLRRNGVQRSGVFNKMNFQENILRIIEDVKQEHIEKTDFYYMYFDLKNKVNRIIDLIRAPFVRIYNGVITMIDEIREEYDHLSDENLG